MAKENKKSSGLPFVIIGLVLVATVIGGFMLYGSSNAANSNKTSGKANNTANTANTPANVPVGAVPPNLAGSPTALVTVEEFADFQCGSCAAAHPTMNEIKTLYGSRIKFIFRNFPLAIPAHDKSYEAAVWTEAASMQGKFWEMHSQFFQNQQAWTANPNYKQLWTEYAQKAGLDAAKFQNDVVGIAAKGLVDADIARGRALNINSTPTIFVNGISVPFSDVNVTSLKQLIDGELQKGAAPAVNTSPASNAANAVNSSK